jgi:4-hydroxy-3-methylbut-2-enyl diphosphate reductase
MALRIEKAGEVGFCFGVKRAVDILERVAGERGGVETLGAVVHNQQVLQRLAGVGVRVAKGVNDIQGDTVVISAHGVNPQLEEEARTRHIKLIDTTCPFVRRAQVAARRLAESGFFVVIYGDINHPEVKGVLGWAKNRGVATLDEKFIGSALAKDSELRIIDTICHDTRKRQAAAVKLANRVDLMLVIGSHTSANTNRIAELCSMATTTHLIESADGIQPLWFQGQHYIGVTAGASTAMETINEVLVRLEAMA